MKKIGILGGGQLARMLSLSAHPLGIHTLCYDPNPEAGAKYVSETLHAPFEDKETLDKFRQQVDTVTFETENIPEETLRFVGETCELAPNIDAILTAQDRLYEKNLFQSLGIDTAPFVAINALQDLQAACDQLGFPSLLKTRRFGYDGKGQYLIKSQEAIQQAWGTLGHHQSLILEGFVNFDREVSLVSVRHHEGHIHYYPLSRLVDGDAG